ncbi:lipopolysaccharide biosynthesis protein [Sphingomonas parva]|uniref:lipopolysaccharide biosynthesis protein n=1 Tax=Sphingomonas parva TaxID=2555898 RepID=UPI001CDC9376|nr:lipopolysaccharide biosynthesis protein [Sphingomonas parva]
MILRQGVGFVVSIVLARILTPADFGLMALVLFFSSFSIYLVQGGISAALIQRQDTTLQEESAIFWWNLIGSVAFGLLLGLASPWIADFYGYPLLQPLLWVAALQIALTGIGAVQTALLTRELRFDRLMIAGIPASLLSGIVGVAAAAQGAGVWALALQSCLMAAINSALIWFISPWRPIAFFRPSAVRGLLGFGAWLGFSNTLELVYSQGFSLLIGKLYGARDLGLYSRAAGTQNLPSGILSSVVSGLAFPIFSAKADDPEALRRGLRMAAGLAMLINVPAMVGLALLSSLVIEVLFGEKWAPAAPILAILAFVGILLPMHVLNLKLLLAQGRADTYFRIEIYKKVIGTGFVVGGSLFGIFGLAYSQLAVAVAAYFVNTMPTARNIGYGGFAQLRDLAGIWGASLGMALVVLLLRQHVPGPPAVQLVALTAAGGVSYLALCFILRVPSLWEAKNAAGHLIADRRARRRGAASQDCASDVSEAQG